MTAQAEAKESVERFVLATCADLAPSEAPSPSLDATLADLGMDSLACADLAVAVEERFGARLGDGDLTSDSHLRDIVGFVCGAGGHGPDLPTGLGVAQGLSAAVIGRAVRAYLRLEVVGREHIPSAGPVIMAANHASAWDIPIHVIGSPRPILFIAKEELYRGPVASEFWRVLGGFSVRRDTADLRAIDRAIRVLEHGKALGIYPEGTRVRNGHLGQFLGGAAWLALLTGAPIVPAGLSGTDRTQRRSDSPRHVRAAFGPPLIVDVERDPVLRRKRSGDLTDELRAAIRSLLL
jgi:1-acyl-sn-glycerol-3-phosphate acyltransferase